VVDIDALSKIRIFERDEVEDDDVVVRNVQPGREFVPLMAVNGPRGGGRSEDEDSPVYWIGIATHHQRHAAVFLLMSHTSKIS
jgi:hypothetical protein